MRHDTSPRDREVIAEVRARARLARRLRAHDRRHDPCPDEPDLEVTARPLWDRTS